MNSQTYIITGPTASGKSDFAHALARKLSGVIINCDSVQLYRGVETIAASPFAGRPLGPDIDGVPYKLFSILDLSTQISVGEYLNLARSEYNAATSAGRPVVFVGGTGFYINAILNGVSPMPDISDAVRRRAREMVAHDIVAARALLPADFKFSDAQRVSRGLEVYLQTGRHITEFQAMPRIGAVAPHARRILICPPRDVLRDRIARRAETMLATDALAEGRAILASNWDPRRAIGADQVCKYLRGTVDRDTAIAEWITRTNQYAKRQRTWFRTQFAADVELDHVPTDADVGVVLEKV